MVLTKSCRLLGFFVLILLSLVSGDTILQNDKFSVKVQNQPIDSEGNYLLSWDVDVANGLVTFEVEAVSTGYVGFGISPNGGMAGADIFIAGVDDNGASYAFDMHGGAENGPPIPDTQSDWNLLEASEDETKTYLKFSRLLNTCDDEDYVISNDTVRIIWSLGATDDVTYHETKRGTQSLNLLMPGEANFNPEEYIKWDVMSEVTMPKADTTYWCSVHKGPELNATHHVISFEAVLDDEIALEHTHHFIIFKCVAPSGQNADYFFGPFVNHPGENCYAPSGEQRLPVYDCLQHYLFVWSKGGKRTVFPADVGYPIPETVGENDYYMLQVHYDNPQLKENRRFKTGARIMYTEKLRDIEAAMLTVAHQVDVSLTVPPDQTDYVVAGQCGSKCTESGITEDNGIHVFNSLLHSHISGKKIKLRHFRGEEELPWFDFDNHYDFNFQQNKPLVEHKQILKGDHLTIECTYNNIWNKGKIVVGGISTREEMCMAFLWYYPKIDFEYCGSLYKTRQHFVDLGIAYYRSSQPEDGGIPKYTIVEPTSLAGDYEESLSTKFNWTKEFTKEFEYKHRYSEQSSICQNSKGVLYDGTVQFPVDLLKYVPQDVCNRAGETMPLCDSGSGRIVSHNTYFCLFALFSWAVVKLAA